MADERLRSIAVVTVIAGALVAGAIAIFAPTSTFDAVLAGFIGQPGDAATTATQRIVAVAGAALAALAMSVVAIRVKARTLDTKPLHCIVVVVLGGLFLLNALSLARRFGAVGDVYPPRWSYTALACAVFLGCIWFLITPEQQRDAPRRGDVPLWVASAGGAGYGCFSGLWHCCAPLWAGSMWTVAINGLWFAALAVTLGAVGRLAASARIGRGEAIGAVVFAVTYPWHTLPFFVQNLVGGAFATVLVRTTGSGWAPAVFLGSAYLTHTTLPFVGPMGAVLAGAILLAYALLVGRQRRIESTSRDTVMQT